MTYRAIITIVIWEVTSSRAPWLEKKKWRKRRQKWVRTKTQTDKLQSCKKPAANDGKPDMTKVLHKS